jgi:uracil-DNA glycosylase
MGIDRELFYDETKIAILPMGLCFPGQDAKGADLPPGPECAPLWQDPIRAALTNIKLTLLIGLYAQTYHLCRRRGGSLTETVRQFSRFAPDCFPLPHPSWRNTSWLKRNPWFEAEALPQLRLRVSSTLNNA